MLSVNKELDKVRFTCAWAEHNDEILTELNGYLGYTTDKNDENYRPLQDNLKTLNKIRLASGKQPTVVELPMPAPVIWEDQRLPASYSNFYIANNLVIMPMYKCPADDKAFYILEECFKNRKVVAIDSTDIIWGLGSFHCLSQQEPATADAESDRRRQSGI